MQLHDGGRSDFEKCLLESGLARRAQYDGFEYSDEPDSFYEKAAREFSSATADSADPQTFSVATLNTTLARGLYFLKQFFGDAEVTTVLDDMLKCSPASRLFGVLNLRNDIPSQGDSEGEEDCLLPLQASSGSGKSLIECLDEFEILSLLPLFDNTTPESNQLPVIIIKVRVVARARPCLFGLLL